MRVLISAGGTGGHINPGLAIANIIKMNAPDSEIVFVGTSRGMENDLVKKAGYELRHVEISGIRRSLSPSNIKTAIQVLTSPHKARKIIKEFRPDIVIGTGGYVCWPSLLAASKLGIPTVLHEANAIPGVAVKQLCGKVDLLMTNFKHTAKEFADRQRTMHVGMPMRGEFEGISKAEARKRLGIDDKYSRVILSFGGSLGAPMVNRAAIEVMKNYTKEHSEVIHYHSSGSREYENMMKECAEAGLDGVKNIEIAPYIYDMSLKMAAADVVISRAGAMTIAELSRLGAVSLLIPSPNVTADHQYKNAKLLEDKGAAIIIRESEFDGHKVSDTVQKLLSEDELRKSMSQNIGNFYDSNTSKKIYSEIEKLVLDSKK